MHHGNDYRGLAIKSKIEEITKNAFIQKKEAIRHAQKRIPTPNH